MQLQPICYAGVSAWQVVEVMALNGGYLDAVPPPDVRRVLDEALAQVLSSHPLPRPHSAQMHPATYLHRICFYMAFQIRLVLALCMNQVVRAAF